MDSSHHRSHCALGTHHEQSERRHHMKTALFSEFLSCRLITSSHLRIHSAPSTCIPALPVSSNTPPIQIPQKSNHQHKITQHAMAKSSTCPSSLSHIHMLTKKKQVVSLSYPHAASSLAKDIAPLQLDGINPLCLAAAG